MEKIAFIGAGNMAEALIRGMIRNRLVSPEPEDLRAALGAMSGDLPEPPELYGDGRTAERILRVILEQVQNRF